MPGRSLRRLAPALRAASLALALTAAPARSAPAQTAAARVTLRVRTIEGHPLEGAGVKCGAAHAATDSAGVARLALAPGARTITIVRLGYLADSLRVVLAAGADTVLDAVLRESGITLAPVVVSSTRAERRIEDEPERVEVLAGEDVSEKSETRPGDVTTVVREIAGVRLQTTASATGAAGLRIQGLRAQYSAVLVDGLPLHGASGAGLGLLQIPPLDLQQAEVIKGAATALYGPAALGGVLDIVTRRPGDAPERSLLLNQTGRGGTDAALWLARRLDERWGMTLLAGGHGQALTDVNRDGWADLPGYARAELRPRLFWTGDGGRTLMATAGTTLEDREGGGDGATRQRVDTRHGDAGLTARLPLGAGDVLALRGAWSGDWGRRRDFDPVAGPVASADLHQTAFGEATLLRARGAVVWLAGAAFELDDEREPDLPALAYRTATPSALTQLTWTATRWLSASGAARLDAPDGRGAIASPRVSLLAHAAHALEARLSAGAGFHVPTPLTEETEALPPTRLRSPADLATERARSLSLDLTARRGALELNATGFLSRLDHAALLVEPADTTAPARAFATLASAPGPTRTAGCEVYAFWSREPLTVTANGSWLDATEVDPASALRRPVPLTPRFSAGLDVAWEEDESGTRAGIEVFYTGRQPLERDPYRESSAPFAVIGVLVAQQVGPALVYVNGEDLADVRQTRFEPVLLPRPALDGRLTVDAWAPADGRAFNGGVRIRF